jgi:hypothetical protein
MPRGSFAPTSTSGGRGPGAGRRWADQPPDRPELFITPKTASVHVSRILAKLGVAGRGEAAAVAHRLGLDR